MSPPATRENALARGRQIRLLLLDVDGVMSDGRIIYDSEGLELKAFHCQDGLGLRLLADHGIATGIITARTSKAVRCRAAELHMRYFFENCRDKLASFEAILEHDKLAATECAYMGDDWIDLPLLNRVGLALAPANAVPEVRSRAHFVTTRAGGQGAVREVCDLLLEAHGLREQCLAQFDR